MCRPGVLFIVLCSVFNTGSADVLVNWNATFPCDDPFGARGGCGASSLTQPVTFPAHRVGSSVQYFSWAGQSAYYDNTQYSIQFAFQTNPTNAPAFTICLMDETNFFFFNFGLQYSCLVQYYGSGGTSLPYQAFNVSIFQCPVGGGSVDLIFAERGNETIFMAVFGTSADTQLTYQIMMYKDKSSNSGGGGYPSMSACFSAYQDLTTTTSPTSSLPYFRVEVDGMGDEDNSHVLWVLVGLVAANVLLLLVLIVLVQFHRFLPRTWPSNKLDLETLPYQAIK